MELLSPAGSFDALRAAVQNGADAVYLGGQQFNARHFAGNFSDIEAAVSYAHLRHCKVYYVLNTLLLDRELADWALQVSVAAQAGVDAFIVQDIGGAGIIQQICPDVPLHASTQMTVHNSPSAQSLKDFGFQRVILSRELTASQTARIRQNTGVDTEVFVHGALCVCYSGQCFFSSMLGGRSANRGMCAQTCRLQYSSGNKSGYLLSTKDLCLVRHIQRLAQAGVKSLKIEGRMKRPDYVAAVTRVYRKAMDGGLLQQSDFDMLALAFNRGGFTTGLFSVDEHRLYSVQPDHLGLAAGKVVAVSSNTITVKDGRALEEGDEIRPALPDAQPAKVLHVANYTDLQEIELSHTKGFSKGVFVRQISSARQLNELRESISGNARKSPLYANIQIREGLPAILELRTDANIITTVASAQPAQLAKSRPITYEDIQKQLGKTGDSPFFIKKIDYSLSPDTAFPFSGLNALRRAAIADISQKILEPYRHQAKAYVPLAPVPRNAPAPRLAAQVSSLQQAAAVMPFVDLLYVPLSASWLGALPAPPQGKVALVGYYPAITSDRGLAELKTFEQRFPTVLVNGFLKTEKTKLGDYGLNLMNSESLAQAHRMGFHRITLSIELNTAQINDLIVPQGLETELIVYGRTPLMVTEHCPIDCDKQSCVVKAGGATITDRMGKSFPLVWEGSHCRVKILNSLPLYMADQLDSLHADVFRMCFTLESPEECQEVAKKYHSAICLSADAQPPDLSFHGEYTRGHFHRGVGAYK